LSQARQPRPLVTVNGVALPASAVIEAEVTNASHFTADTFRLVLAANGLPPQLGPAYWAGSADDRIGIAVTLGASSLPPSQLILGQVDQIDYDLLHKTITLTGRDLSAPLIDTKTSEKFQNLTASQIAQQIALRHGLDSDVEQTTTLAGTYYDQDHTVLTHEQTEWDLLIYLAEHEGFDVWVSGMTLFFQPSPVASTPPYLLRWSQPGAAPPDSNALDIALQRSQTLARDIIVKVRSWNQIQQKTFTATFKVTQARKGQRAGGIAQLYSYTVPNLTQDDVNRLARTKAEEITRHERVLTASLPGDNTLSTRAVVNLTGTGTDWDQSYFPDSIMRRLTTGDGYRMELRAKNHSTQSTVFL
jgi:uncharacterized protein involved in type VI secretion and phage assembly